MGSPSWDTDRVEIAPSIAAWIALSVLLCALAPAPARAQGGGLRVRVLSESRIELRIARDAEVVEVEGFLRDDQGAGLADRPVFLRIQPEAGGPPESARVQSGVDGAFQHRFALAPGQYRLTAAFEGGGEDPYQSHQVVQRIDLQRAHVRLEPELAEGNRLDLDREDHAIRVRAHSEAGASGLAIEVRDENDRVLGHATTDQSGEASFRIASSALGPPSSGRLLFRSAGDPQRAEAQTEVPVVRFLRSSLELSVSPRSLTAGEAVRARGRLRNSAGPLPRCAVGIYAGERHLRTLLTDAEGRFQAQVELHPDDRGQVRLHASFESDAPWHQSARSEPIAIEVEGAGGTPFAWLLVPFAVTALLLLFWLRRRPRDREERGEDAEQLPGIALGRPQQGFRRAQDLGGLVTDADRLTPLAGVRVTLTMLGRQNEDENLVEIFTDDRGRFRVETLPEGEWLLRVEKAGYEGCSQRCQSPHRGQWSEIRVRLRDLRELAWMRYREVALARLPSRSQWGLWTARELLAYARKKGHGSQALGELTEGLERIAYGSEIPDADSVHALEAQAEESLREAPPPRSDFVDGAP